MDIRLHRVYGIITEGDAEGACVGNWGLEGERKPRRETQKESGEGKGRKAGFSQWRPPARRLRGEMEITNWGSEGEGSGGRDGWRGDDDFGCKKKNM